MVGNSYALPQIVKLQFYFVLRQLEDVDEVQIYNYFYVFKYFFGVSAFLTKTNSFFNLGKWTYSFNVNLCVSKNKLIYSNLFFLINDIYCLSERMYLK